MAIDIDISSLCVSVRRGRQLCITFPGGAEVCAQFGIDLGDAGAITRSLLGEINSALAPLVPLFNILDVVLAVVECVKAIPDAVSVPPDPTKLAQCIPGLLEAVNKILGLVLQIPKMVKQILLAIIEAVLAIIGELEAFIDYEIDLLNAATAAAEPGNIVLQSILDCEQGNFELDLANLNESMKPLNRLIGVVNLILEPLTGQTVPGFDDLGESAKDAIQPLRVVLEQIQAVVALLPG